MPQRYLTYPKIRGGRRKGMGEPETDPLPAVAPRQPAQLMVFTPKAGQPAPPQTPQPPATPPPESPGVAEEKFDGTYDAGTYDAEDPPREDRPKPKEETKDDDLDIWGAVCRVLESLFALISWVALINASQPGFGGYYRYESYTALKFAVTCGVWHWLFTTFVVLCKGTKCYLNAKHDLRVSCVTFALVYTAMTALAVTSTTAHDSFGPDDSSLCEPSDVKSQQKRRADHFCQHLDVALTFAIFATAASCASLYKIINDHRSQPHSVLATAAPTE